MASLSEIAKKCGVSCITVSRALDPQKAGKVKPATREKILDVCAKEKFYPSFSARSLASGKTRSIGFIIPGMSMIAKSIQTATYLEELNTVLEKAGYNLQLLPVNGSDWETIRRNAEQLILSNRCDGYLTAAFTVSLPADCPVTVLQTTASEMIRESHFPVVSINSDQAMQRIIEHLHRSKYRKAAFIHAGKSKPLRAAKWQKNFAASALMPELELFPLPMDPLPYPYDPNVQNVMLRNVEQMMRYDVWIFNNDWHALLAKNLLEQKGLVPGKDIALIGFDNVEESSRTPEITTINPPLTEFGRTAAEQLLEQIRNPGSSCSSMRIELEAQAIFRKSTQRV